MGSRNVIGVFLTSSIMKGFLVQMSPKSAMSMIFLS